MIARVVSFLLHAAVIVLFFVHPPTGTQPTEPPTIPVDLVMLPPPKAKVAPPPPAPAPIPTPPPLVQKPPEPSPELVHPESGGDPNLNPGQRPDTKPPEPAKQATEAPPEPKPQEKPAEPAKQVAEAPPAPKPAENPGEPEAPKPTQEPPKEAQQPVEEIPIPTLPPPAPKAKQPPAPVPQQLAKTPEPAPAPTPPAAPDKTAPQVAALPPSSSNKGQPSLASPRSNQDSSPVQVESNMRGEGGGDRYLNALRDDILSNLIYPNSARGASGVAKYAMIVDRRGYLRALRLVQSSGSTALDRAGMDAIQNTAPFRPLPVNIQGETVGIEAVLAMSPQ
ncbi:MAG TPA: TonB family protein [Alphaproteobacteria bacterium]|nr:TonB family protein [Alphaproteobacteria bacterium]